MKCYKCSNNAEIEYQNGSLCARCFLDILYRRVQKELGNHPFKKDERVLVCGELAESFLRQVNKIPIDIIGRNQQEADSKDIAAFDRVVIPWTADDEAEAFYLTITSKEPILEENIKVIKLFKSLSDYEVLSAAKILGITHQQKQRHPDIEAIRKKYHNAMSGLSKSADELREALR